MFLAEQLNPLTMPILRLRSALVQSGSRRQSLRETVMRTMIGLLLLSAIFGFGAAHVLAGNTAGMTFVQYIAD
jgi:hypothetical protein